MLADIRKTTIARLECFRPDVVHLHNVAAIGGHVLAASVLRRWPTVWTAHDRYPFELFHNSWEMNGATSTTWEYSPGSRPARVGLDMFRVAPVPMQFLTPSQWLAGYAREYTTGSAHRVDVVPNLIPEGRPGAVTRLADQLGVDLVALAVIPNPSYPLKGFETIRRALAIANASLDLARIGIVVTTDATIGQGRDGIFTTPELFDRGLVEQSGYLGKASMAALYRGADLVTIGSWIENMPNVAIEAAAAGRPVIGTAVGGIPEVVRPGETGWLVEPGDAAAIARALCEALDESLRSRLGAAAKAAYQQHNHPDVVTERHLAIFGSTIDRWTGDAATLIGTGIDFSAAAFAPPSVATITRPHPIRRYSSAALRHARAAPARLRRWYHRRSAERS